jgi:xanthine phosphoribosyltransferase
MKKIYISWSDAQRQVQEILRQIQQSGWQPDYVVGLTRGGLMPANLISQYLEIPMETLKVSLRDTGTCESNCWMAEDAFGYVPKDHTIIENAGRSDPAFKKNILIVDDINDSGATINWIRQDWQTSCLPNDHSWASVWNNNVRVAVLVDNQSSNCELKIDYSAIEVNKLEDPQWIVFPWEEWWCNWMPKEKT